MSVATVRKCDRCSAEIGGPPWLPITLHRHHEKKLDLCSKCAKALDHFLDGNEVGESFERYAIPCAHHVPCAEPACSGYAYRRKR